MDTRPPLLPSQANKSGSTNPLTYNPPVKLQVDTKPCHKAPNIGGDGKTDNSAIKNTSQKNLFLESKTCIYYTLTYYR